MALIFSSSLRARKLTMNTSFKSFERLFVERLGTRHNGLKCPLKIAVIYRPPGQNMKFLSEFEILLGDFNDSNDILMIDDFNIHVDDVSNSTSRSFIGLLHQFS